MSSFKAGAQYGDWEGTASADDSDQTSLEDYLREKKLIGPDEFLLATSLWAGENHGSTLGRISVSAYLFKGGPSVDNVDDALGNDSCPIPVREVEISFALSEFVCLFKRFSVMLTWKGLVLEGREYDVRAD
jgi:hypothetical protein